LNINFDMKLLNQSKYLISGAKNVVHLIVTSGGNSTMGQK